jgi:hypothetical protein
MIRQTTSGMSPVSGVDHKQPLAASYLKAIKAPRKSFVAIKGGGHFAVSP